MIKQHKENITRCVIEGVLCGCDDVSIRFQQEDDSRFGGSRFLKIILHSMIVCENSDADGR